MTTSGRTLAAGVLIGLGVALSLGTAGQPANQQADRVLAQLNRIERGLLRQDSKLPADPKRSIESMLEELVESNRRMEAVLGALDGPALEELARRVRAIHDSLIEVEVAELAEVDRRLDDLERQFDRMAPGERLQDVLRRLEEMDRRLRTDLSREVEGNQRRIDDARREIRSLQRDVRRLEAKIG